MFVSRYCSIGFYVFLNLNVFCHAQRPKLPLSNGNVAYPESEEENPDRQNAQNKTPVYLANLCRPGEILYPGDQLDDWVCDCKPAYIYFPMERRCYPAYSRGPCDAGQYLILPKNSVVPECRYNRCMKDNFVWFRDACHELDKEGPCVLGTQISNVVGVNETTLEIICTKDYKIEFTGPRMSEDDAQANSTTDMAAHTGSGNVITTPQVASDNPNPIVNGFIYTERRCFVGGIRWTNIKCPEQHFYHNYYNSNYNYYNKNRNPNPNPQHHTNYPSSNRETQINQNIQDIFFVPSSV